MDVVNGTSPPAVAATMPAKYTQLIHICAVMQGIVGEEWFFLDSRRAGERLGVSAMTAWRQFMVLCRCGILDPGDKGNPRRSNRYRFVADWTVMPRRRNGWI
jgi:hypothetical protein